MPRASVFLKTMLIMVEAVFLVLSDPAQLEGTITFSGQFSQQAIIEFTDTVVTSLTQAGQSLTVNYGDNQTVTYGLVNADGRENPIEVQLQRGGTELVIMPSPPETSIVGTAPSELHSV
jgi:hypothetical protein